MPAFCPKCGDHVDLDVCEKCGEAGVATQVSAWKDPIKTAGTTVEGTSAGYIPSAFAAAGRLHQNMGGMYMAPPPRREKATALYDFMPQDKSTQLRLRKGDSLEIIRKDSDGWWFVVVDGEKGLVPGSYVRVDNPVATGPDPAILSAREASNQRFNQWRQASATQPAANGGGVVYDSPLGLSAANGGDAPAPNGPAHVDARASDGVDDKPTVVRKLKKCRACNETILGRTKSAKGDIFHEICLICRGCRETIEEDDEFTIVKKKAYHAECAKEMVHCRTCDKEILGRAYKVAGSSFHKLCMTCEQCSKPFEENGATLEGEMIVCNTCIEERRRKEEEAKAAARAAEEARIAAAKAKEEARLAELRAAEAREAERREAEEREAAERAAEARAAEEQAAAAKAAEEKAAEAAKLAEETALLSLRESEKSGNNSTNQRHLHSSFIDTSNLDEFDLGAASIRGNSERMSDSTDLDFENDYGGSFVSLNGERDSLRLSQVIDFGAVNAFHGGHQNNGDRMSTLSDLSNISENDDFANSQNIGGTARLNASALHDVISEDEEEDEDGEREQCGGCGSVLEGEAIGALNKYFHHQCFKCSYCKKTISEEDGYAEKDNMAFHQACYQAKYSKRCCRCTKVLKGKVVKALDSLYHPDCFVCFQCNSSLSESFFEHDGQAVCAQCKHIAITANAAPVADDLVALSLGTVGYHFAAQDETQLTILPGQQVSILQKDDDGWWFVDLDGLRGYVPGSYLIEHPVPPKKTAKPQPKPQPKPEPKPEPKVEPAAPAKVPGLCSECGTQNPDVARFCRSCGNGLMD